MVNLFLFMADRADEILRLTGQHLYLSIMGVLLGMLVGIPLGILLTRRRNLSAPVLGIANILQTIPSLALLGLLIPLLGIGSPPAIVALFVYSLLVIIRNTYTGINQVDKSMIEAGVGMGMTNFQILRMVELPLAFPVIMAGIRVATVTCVGIATLCAAIGAGGLGQFIFRGIAMVNNNMILTGAIPAALLALFLDFILGRFEKALSPRGLKIKRRNDV